MYIVIVLILLLAIMFKDELNNSIIHILGIGLVGISGILLMQRGNSTVYTGGSHIYASKRHNSKKYTTSKKIHGKKHTASKIYVEPRLTLKNTICTDVSHKACYPTTSEFKEMIDTGKPLYLSHIRLDAPVADDFNRCITKDSERKQYVTRRNEFKRALHWGQLKLMLTEIEFLTLVMLEYNESKDDRDIIFVYAGAAPGHHTEYLSSLFPEIHFELYDPNRFAIKESKMIKIHTGEINGMFTPSVAKYWKEQVDKYVVFCSDIRTEPATDENVIANMNMQLEWWTIMQPMLSMFKFRLPWYAGITKYVVGDIYIQPYPGPTSTESRLIVKAGAKLIDYDNVAYEEQMFYHNTVNRYKSYKCILGDLDLERDHLDNCYDCVSFINIVTKYLQLMKKPVNKDTIYKLVVEIQTNITHVHNIYSQTIRSFNEFVKVFSNVCFKTNGSVCEMCQDPVVRDGSVRRWPGASKATLKSYETAVSVTDVRTKSYRQKVGGVHDGIVVHDICDDNCTDDKHYAFVPDGDSNDAVIDDIIDEPIIDEPIIDEPDADEYTHHF